MAYYFSMSIHISFFAPGITSFSANLKDEALPELFRLVQELRDDSVAPQVAAIPPETPMPSLPAVAAVTPAGNPPLTSGNEAKVKDWLKAHGAAELLNVLKKWDSFYEKIVLLATWHESRGLHTPWKSADIVEVFNQAKEKAPTNFPRDISRAIQSGLVHAESARTYSVTRSGWNKIAQEIEVLQS